jgi:UDP-N-acetylenolpyruvoylglucosamine reductase
MYVIGNGTNLLVKDAGFRGIIIKLEFEDIKILKNTEEQIILEVGVGVKIPVLTYFLAENSVTGMEWAAGIPRNSWWSYKNECGCVWRRNERCSYFYTIYQYRWKHWRTK